MDASNLPIDIHSGKLLGWIKEIFFHQICFPSADWLISRHHCERTSADDRTHLVAIHERIQAALQDMPEHEAIVKLLTGAGNFVNLILIF